MAEETVQNDATRVVRMIDPDMGQFIKIRQQVAQNREDPMSLDANTVGERRIFQDLGKIVPTTSTISTPTQRNPFFNTERDKQVRLSIAEQNDRDQRTINDYYNDTGSGYLLRRLPFLGGMYNAEVSNALRRQGQFTSALIPGLFSIAQTTGDLAGFGTVPVPTALGYVGSNLGEWTAPEGYESQMAFAGSLLGGVSPKGKTMQNLERAIEEAPTVVRKKRPRIGTQKVFSQTVPVETPKPVTNLPEILVTMDDNERNIQHLIAKRNRINVDNYDLNGYKSRHYDDNSLQTGNISVNNKYAVEISGRGATTSDIMYKLARKLPAPDKESQQIFTSLGVSGKHYNVDSWSDGRSVTADLRSHLIRAGKITEKSIRTGKIGITVDELPLYLSKVHRGGYLNEIEHAKIHGFVKGTTKNGTRIFQWDPTLSPEQKLEIFNRWQRAVYKFKNGNKILPRRFFK